jgi:phospholipid/cholesterol/gamma-HCH transport system substrate-binding protein
MSRNTIETVLGAVVLVVAALFLFFAYTTSQVRAVPGYQVTADFDRIDGIRDGSDVRISGIKVGSVIGETLDPKTFLVTVRMSIAPQYKLPEDTVAEIVSSSLLGDKYMALVPGGSDKIIPAGGRIKYTQAPASLENLIGQMIYSPSAGQQQPGGKAAPPGGKVAPPRAQKGPQ